MGRKPAEKGHNSGPVNIKLLQDYAIAISKEEDILEEARGRIKARLAAAKNDGFLKTSLRGAVKDLRITEQQLQAKKEIEDARQHYYDACKDLPLFAKAREERRKQFDEEEEEEA